MPIWRYLPMFMLDIYCKRLSDIYVNIAMAIMVKALIFPLTFYVTSREVGGIFIFEGIFQNVAEMSLKKVVDRGNIFMFFYFLLTNIFNIFKKSLKFQMFRFLSLIFVYFTKSH